MTQDSTPETADTTAATLPVKPSQWSDLNLSPEMLSVITQAGYKVPSPVQVQSIPPAMAGKDVLVSSQTGSGKTASFVIPAVERFKGKNGTYILALSPTREIAQQTGAAFEQFGAPFGLKTVVCIGGASIPLEKEALATSPHIIVATPGRLGDHLERGNVWLDFIECLIFDEADRMLDMGFASQIELITEQIPKTRQTMMFSATFAPSVEKLARKVMRDPVQVTIGKSSTSVPQISEVLLHVPERAKTGALMRIMRKEPGTMFVFANSKEKVSTIWRQLHSQRIYDVGYIHSDCTQEHRSQTIQDFKAGQFRVLIATDVAGRGIDVEDVAHVVNYDLPREAEDYIHRIGRTGRKGKVGHSTSFAGERDENLVRAIEKLIGHPLPVDDGPRRRPEGEPRPRRDEGDRRPPPQRQERGARSPRTEQNAARPEHQGPRPRRQRFESPEYRPPRPSQQQAPTPSTPSTHAAKSGGFLGWVKRLFS